MTTTNPTLNGGKEDSFRFEASCRLRSHQQFQHVYRTKCSVADNVLIVYAAENPCNQIRLGLSVSRKVGNAVTRNHWKRQIREAFRLQRHQLPSGVDFVVIPRKSARPTTSEVLQSFANLAGRVCRKLNQRRDAAERRPQPDQSTDQSTDQLPDQSRS